MKSPRMLVGVENAAPMSRRIPPGVAVTLRAALIALTLALTLGAGTAGAIVAKIGGRGYGVTPINGVNPATVGGAYRAPGPSQLTGAGGGSNFDEGGPLLYHGGPVMHSNTTHVIYWDPNKEFKATTTEIIGSFFANVAHDSGLPTNVYGVDAQYTDGTGNAAYSSTFGGAVTDPTSYPASGCAVPALGDPGPPYTECLTDGQVQHELSTYISKEKLQAGPTQLYFLLLPHSVVTCFPQEECSSNVFCAYHSSVEPGTAGEIIYATIPFSLLDAEKKAFTIVDAKGCQFDGNTGIQQPNPDNEGGENNETRFADIALKYISHEYSEAITDPLVGAESAWFDGHGNENGDKCNATGSGLGADENAFLPTSGGTAVEDNLFDQLINSGSYYLQSEWDNANGACLMRPAPLTAASFNATPPSAGAGVSVSFNGTALDPYGNLELAWTFGDGGTGTGSSPSHTYAVPGQYAVRMAPTDRLTRSSAATIEHTIVINDLATAAFTSSPNPTTVGASVSFNGLASSDPDGAIENYAWNFGDGATGSGATPSHSYGAGGNYTVTLTVTDSAGETASASHQITVSAPVVPPVAPTLASETTTTAPGAALVTLPNSSFGPVGATIAQTTGAIRFTESVSDPGTFSWLLTFQNGKFGAFASASAKCKAGFIKLSGKCRPAKIVFAKGSKTVTVAGTVTVALKPSASALKALRNALKQRKGVQVTATLTFQSLLGGSPVSRTRSVMVKLKK